MDEKLKNYFLEFLLRQKYVVLAVRLENNKPWVVPVTIRKWQRLELDWESKNDKLHSKAIEIHPEMAITMFDTDSKDGFYAEATGKKLYDMEEGFARYQVTIQRAWHNGTEHIKREVDLDLLDGINFEKQEE